MAKGTKKIEGNTDPTFTKSAHETATDNKIPKLPPIYAYRMTNYKQMVRKLCETIKINNNTSFTQKQQE